MTSTRIRSSRILTAVCLAMLALAGCGGDKNTKDFNASLEELYQKGRKSMESGNYRNAITYFEALTARFPFSNQAKQAQLDLIYAYYSNGDKDLAIDAATQFERENPTHPRVDYALYMRGLAQFHGEHNAFHKLFRMNLAKRPPLEARESFSAFSQLVRRYPDSVYAPDARQRMIFLRNRLAEHEVHVARYYMRRGAYAAALKRSQFVLQTYDGAPATADALDIMVRAYDELGMADLAADARYVLRENFPDRPEPDPPKKEKAFIFF